jgi:hypothetical protein
MASTVSEGASRPANVDLHRYGRILRRGCISEGTFDVPTCLVVGLDAPSAKLEGYQSRRAGFVTAARRRKRGTIMRRLLGSPAAALPLHTNPAEASRVLRPPCYASCRGLRRSSEWTTLLVIAPLIFPSQISCPALLIDITVIRDTRQPATMKSSSCLHY